jgi:hypothetical protein
MDTLRLRTSIIAGAWRPSARRASPNDEGRRRQSLEHYTEGDRIMSRPNIDDITINGIYFPETYTPYQQITLTIRGSGFTRRHLVCGMSLPKSSSVSRAYVKQWVERYVRLRYRTGGLPLEMRVFRVFRKKLHSDRLITCNLHFERQQSQCNLPYYAVITVADRLREGRPGDFADPYVLWLYKKKGTPQEGFSQRGVSELHFLADKLKTTPSEEAYWREIQILGKPNTPKRIWGSGNRLDNTSPEVCEEEVLDLASLRERDSITEKDCRFPRTFNRRRKLD